MNPHPTNRLPAEWEPQSAVMLTWPHPHGDWAPWLAEVEPVFVEIAHQVALRERLIISCYDTGHEARIRNLLEQIGIGIPDAALSTYVLPSNDSWVRDHGPITVQHNDAPCLLDFTFNGWGAKFGSELDNTLTRRLHEMGAFGTMPLQTVDLVMEGGSLEVDGRGTLLTTTRCLLSPQRNPHLDRAEIEAALHTHLGISRVLWLAHGALAGDDTDSHIDTLARFCNPETITYVACDNEQDQHYPELKDMEAELRQFRTAQGQPYTLIPLPWPGAKFAADGKRLPASYANFLIINGAVLVPTYDDPADAAALACLQTAFPDHDIIGIDCGPLILQYGSLHCVTMQVPRVF